MPGAENTGGGRPLAEADMPIYEKTVPCKHCAGRRFPLIGNGNGTCARCFGSGVNLNLSSRLPSCQDCNGTGVCHKCGGAGSLPVATSFAQWLRQKGREGW